MIVFQKLRWKNFLSFGNQFTEIQLDGSPTNLIIGTNGVGKSTFLDALTFALYGKAFRKINKPQLINSINGNSALVEIEFMIGGNQYLVRRGIKPNIFEIYENGDPLEQDAKMGDYQGQLENHIIKMNYTAFTQIVVLGKAVYTPFMRLTTPKRTELIEELLGISVFSDMQIDVKEQLKSLNDGVMASMDRLVLNQERKQVKLDYINVLSEDKTTRIQELHRERDESMNNLRELGINLEVASQDLENSINNFSEYLDTDKKANSLRKIQADFDSKVKNLNQEIKFFEDNRHCPVCDQNIGEDVRQESVGMKKSKLKEIQDGEKILHEKMIENNVRVKMKQVIDKDIQALKITNATFSSQMNNMNANINNIEAKIAKLNDDSGNVDDIQADINIINQEYIEIKTKMDELKESLTYYNELNLLLKDGGVKTLIIKKYLPIFNQMINGYLAKLGIFTTFSLDENFNETILSRNHDKFSYNSFSEGEKLRIDLAILLAWRDISRMKSAKDTNLIIMDEIFDSSLDQSGVDAFVDILPSMVGVNIFVISHTPDKLMDKFKNVIKIKKSGNFSEIQQSHVV